MHPNPIYHSWSPEAGLRLACERGFGAVTAALPTGLFAAHVPFCPTPDTTPAQPAVELHLMRANPLAKAAQAAPVPVMLLVSLCDAYVSPDWYEIADQVPTWLYGAVHLHGRLAPMADEALESVLTRISDTFERRLAPTPPWTMEKMSPEAKTKMMRMIQPFTLMIDRVESTDKFAQNKPADALQRLVPQLAKHSFGHEVAQVANHIRRFSNAEIA